MRVLGVGLSVLHRHGRMGNTKACPVAAQKGGGSDSRAAAAAAAQDHCVSLSPAFEPMRSCLLPHKLTVDAPEVTGAWARPRESAKGMAIAVFEGSTWNEKKEKWVLVEGRQWPALS